MEDNDKNAEQLIEELFSDTLKFHSQFLEGLHRFWYLLENLKLDSNFCINAFRYCNSSIHGDEELRKLFMKYCDKDKGDIDVIHSLYDVFIIGVGFGAHFFYLMLPPESKDTFQKYTRDIDLFPEETKKIIENYAKAIDDLPINKR